LDAVVKSERIRLGALASTIGATDATASRTVDSLEERGLVVRRVEPADRRGVVVSPTASGRRVSRSRRTRLVHLLDQLVADSDAVSVMHLVDLVSELNALLGVRETPGEASGRRVRAVSTTQ
jgi:DNA-binding MarR family transcriptional regulator